MVSEVAEQSVQYIPMSYDDYLALPEHTHAEWVDGVVVVAPAARYGHQTALRRLAHVIEDALPALFITIEQSTQLPRNRERVPDVVAFSEEPPAEEWLMTQTPVLVAEVLSPSTQREDLLRKAPEYLEAGIGQYWVVDRHARTIEVLSNAGERWETVAIVDDARPSADVVVGEWGTVPLDIRTVLGDAGGAGGGS